MDAEETHKHPGGGKEPAATLRYTTIIMLTVGKEGGFPPHTSNASSVISRHALLKICFQLYSAVIIERQFEL